MSPTEAALPHCAWFILLGKTILTMRKCLFQGCLYLDYHVVRSVLLWSEGPHTHDPLCFKVYPFRKFHFYSPNWLKLRKLGQCVI